MEDPLSFEKALGHSKNHGHYHVHVRKQRLLAGAKKDHWNRCHNVNKHDEQNEPLNLSVAKNRTAFLVEKNRVNNSYYSDDETPLIIDETKQGFLRVEKPTTQQILYKHFKKRKLLQQEKLQQQSQTLQPAPLDPENNQFKCELCSVETTGKLNFRQHMKEHAPKRKHVYECRNCGPNSKRSKSQESCKKCEAAQRHLLKKKRKVVDVVHQCGNCEYKTGEIEAFEEHLRRHADEVPFRCSICAFETPWRTEFSFHVEKHYGLKVNHKTQW